MFPAIACRISSRLGLGFASTSAAAETICPGVQKPHCSASVADEGVDQRMVAQAFDRRHLAFVDRVDERDAGERGHAVEQHRAGAAVAFVAADLRPRQAEVVAQDDASERPTSARRAGSAAR